MKTSKYCTILLQKKQIQFHDDVWEGKKMNSFIRIYYDKETRS